MKQFLTVSDVAKLLKVAQMTIYRMVKNNSIPYVRYGPSNRAIRFDPVAIENWLKNKSNPVTERAHK